MKNLVITILFLTTLVGSSAAAEIHLEQQVSAVPAEITDVFSCGQWENNKSSGFYRILYAEFYRGNSLLYIQWIQDMTLRNPTRQTLYTLSIKEFNADDHQELTFDKPKCVEDESGIHLKIAAESAHDGSNRLFDLAVYHELGKYLISEAAEKKR